MHVPRNITCHCLCKAAPGVLHITPPLCSRSPPCCASAVCDYTEVYNKHAYPSTKCFGTSCSGTFFKPVTRQ